MIDYGVVYSNNKQENTELYIVNCGIQEHNPHHRFGPIVRDHYVIQYLTSGCGRLVVNRKLYDIQEGDLMVLPKGEMCYYESDEKNPYAYPWIGINGVQVEKLLSASGVDIRDPIIAIRDPTVSDLMKLVIESIRENNYTNIIKAQGHLYILFSYLLSRLSKNNELVQPKKAQYVEDALAFIAANYMKDIKIDDIALFLHINRSYFYSIFNKSIHMSPINYLIQYRIEKSKFFLSNTNLSIGEIAEKVGFSQNINFTVRFKKIEKITPSDYRKANEKSTVIQMRNDK